MSKSKKFLISVPYIYPVCPLSIDHAKIMLVADIIARTASSEGKEVYFPIAAHYSGVTAEESIKKMQNSNVEIKKTEREKYLNIYKTPRKVVDSFVEPEILLDYYSSQTILDLKRLDISCNYENFYKTTEDDYSIFVNTIFEKYDNNYLLIKNSKNELSLDYNNVKWRTKTYKNFINLNYISPSLKNNITSAFQNIRNDWGILRDYGIGIKYKKNYVIDPMFDSELFVLYDLYKKFEHFASKDKKKMFNLLFENLLSNNKKNIKNKLIKSILEWLPTDVFVCEEHLKNWIVKKTYVETLLFNKRFHTKTYFITGMGYIDGKRMSSSRGTAILLKDLLNNYGANMTRMIIMFTGGHPSKMYNYSVQNIDIIRKMLEEFYEHINYINAKIINKENYTVEYSDEFNYLNELLHNGYYQQLLVEILKNLPKKCYNTTNKEIIKRKNTISYFLKILLPSLKI